MKLEDEVSYESVRLAARVALAAINAGHISMAASIVDGLQSTFGQYASVAMAKVTLVTAQGRYAEALSHLDSMMNDFPTIASVRCSYAILCRELGVPGWRRVAQSVIDDGSDKEAIEVAKGLLSHPGTGITKSALEVAGVDRFN